MWSVPGDMTIASQLEGRHLSLKQLAAINLILEVKY